MTTNNLFRDLLDGRIPVPAKPKPPTVADAFQLLANIVTEAFRDISAAFQPLVESLQDLGVIEPPPPTDPREFALWHKQQRGTGPNATPLRVRGRTTHYKEKG